MLTFDLSLSRSLIQTGNPFCVRVGEELSSKYCACTTITLASATITRVATKLEPTGTILGLFFSTKFLEYTPNQVQMEQIQNVESVL